MMNYGRLRIFRPEDPPRPSLPAKPEGPLEYVEGFEGKRSPFGPVTIFCVTDLARHVAGYEDWTDDEDRLQLAKNILGEIGVWRCTEETYRAFSEQVLFDLPSSGWSMTVCDIRRWNEKWLAKRHRVPDDTDDTDDEEQRMLEMVRKIPLPPDPGVERVRETLRGLELLDENEGA